MLNPILISAIALILAIIIVYVYYKLDKRITFLISKLLPVRPIKDKEEIKKEIKEENKLHIKELNRKYYLKHRDKLKRKAKKRYHQNKKKKEE